MISARRFLLIVFAVGVAINIYLAYSYRNYKIEKRLVEQEEKNKNFLERCHAYFTFSKVYKPKFEELFAKIEGKTVSEMENVFSEWCRHNSMPEEAFNIVVFNVPDISKNPPERHIALNIKDKKSKEDWEFAMRTFDAGDYKNFQRVTGDDRKRLVQTLTVGVGFSQIVRRPGIIIEVGISDVNTYAIWMKAKKTVEPNKINAAIFLANKKYLDSRIDSLAKSFFEEHGLSNDKYGYFNSFDPSKSYLPTGFSSTRINEILNGHDIKSGFKKLPEFGISAYGKPNGNVFIVVDQKPFTSFPIWTTALFFFWFPVWFMHFRNAKGVFKLSLKSLSGIMFLLVVVQPSMLIVNYWDKLLESKREVIREEKIGDMLNYLVQIDTNETEINRIFRERCHNMVNIVKKTKDNPLGVDNPEKLQDFIDETMRLELDGVYDTCLLYDENGNNLRDYATTSGFVRRLALYPKNISSELIRQYALNGWTPFNGELQYIEDNYQENFDMTKFLILKPPQGTMALIPIVKAITSELIDVYNRKNHLSSETSMKKQLSSGVLASMMGGKSEEYLGSMYNSLGDFFEFGYGSEISLNYIDLLYDKNGRAKYGMFLFCGIYNFTKAYLERVFVKNAKMPKDIEYMAISKYKLTMNFPYVDLWERLNKMFEIMEPPNNQYYEETNINGRPSLLCAYRGNKIENYVLLASMPLAAIDKEMNMFEIKLLLAILICITIIGYIIYRIYLNVIEPTQTLVSGIEAINGEQYGKIYLETEDEWEQLAYAYNQSIESMSELKIATFLKGTILPSGIQNSGLIKFLGRTISADGIGGDYFDLFKPTENEMMFMFGDVSGHSVGAALVVSMAHAGFASLFDSGIREPYEILRSFSNLMLTSLKRVKMMTCFSGYIDCEGNMKCSNAGQTFPLIVDEDGNITKISVIGYPLGVSKRTKFSQTTVKLPNRCRIVLYSDGIIEAMNSEGTLFGYDRFEELVRKMACNNSMEDFCEEVYKNLREYSDPVPWNDDCSIAVIDYTKPAAENKS